MIIKPFRLATLSVILILLQSCNSEYEQMVTRELASGEIENDLFFGLELGMSSKEFFGKCWELNNDSLLYHGALNMSIEHRFELNGKSAKMNFYPEFHEGKVYEMPVVFSYNAYAPWNQAYSVDTLLQESIAHVEQWYGEGFIKMEHPEKGVAYAKVDGNRRVMLYPGDEKVNMLVTDLLVENQIKNHKLGNR